MTMTQPEEIKKPLSGKQFALILLAFFLTFASVDAYFIYSATTTHPGVTDDNAYEKGLRYNDTIRAADEAAALGWSIDTDYAQGQLRVKLLTKESKPLDGAVVTAVLIRPLEEGLDQKIALNPVGQGRYTAAYDFARLGQWDIRIFVQWKTQKAQKTTRLVVKN